MATITRNLRPYLKYIRNQRRTYADKPISDEMKFTFAGANQVINIMFVYIIIYYKFVINYYRCFMMNL